MRRDKILLKNGKARGIYSVVDETKKNGGEAVVEWIWTVCIEAWKRSCDRSLDEGSNCSTAQGLRE